jgi:hypothetical protein
MWMSSLLDEVCVNAVGPATATSQLSHAYVVIAGDSLRGSLGRTRMLSHSHEHSRDQKNNFFSQCS